MEKLEKIFEADAVAYTGRTTKARIVIPEKVGEQIKATYAKLGAFEIPVKALNDLIGFSGNLENPRRTQLRNMLNKQYKPSKEGTYWYVGIKDKNTKYVIDTCEPATKKEKKEA